MSRIKHNTFNKTYWEPKTMKSECSQASHQNDFTVTVFSGHIAKAAGTSCKIIKKLNDQVTLVSFPTGQIKEISNQATATIGKNSNPEHFNTSLGKAGASRWLGIRPKTRGEAMNPVDHPHGGKSHGSGGKGNKQKNRWGKLAKSKK